MLYVRVCAHSLSHVWLFVTPWTVGPSVHGIFLTRIPECVAISYSRESSWPRYQTHMSYISYTDRQILCHLGSYICESSSLIFSQKLKLDLSYGRNDVINYWKDLNHKFFALLPKLDKYSTQNVRSKQPLKLSILANQDYRESSHLFFRYVS